MTSPQFASEPQEIPAGASETQRLTRQPDGRVTLEVWSRPARIRDRSGSWAWIDTTLVEKDGAIQPRIAKYHIAFSPGGADKPLIDFRLSDQRTLSIAWPKSLPRPTLKGAQAIYADAAGPGADLVLSALAEGFRYDIVYRSRPTGATAIALPLHTRGLTVREDQQGRITIADQHGKRVALGSAATVRAQQPPARSRLKVNSTSGVKQLVITPDQQLFARADSARPVTLAAVVNAGEVIDVDVADDGGLADPTLPFLTAGSIFGLPSRAYMRFDMGETFKHGEVAILDAKLTVLNTDGPDCGDAVGPGIQARRVTGDWNPSNLTWANKPATTSEAAVTVTKSYASQCGEGVLEWPMADMVRSWLRGSPYFGVELRGANESSPDDNWRTLASSEHPNASTPPKLTIDFDGTGVPATTQSAAVGNRLSAGEMSGQQFEYLSLYGRTGFYNDDLDQLAKTGSIGDTGFPRSDWPSGEEWPFPGDPNVDPPYTHPQPGEPTDSATTPRTSPSVNAATSPDDVLAIWEDRDKKRIYYRRGYYNAPIDDGFGDVKIRQKHNLTQRAVAATVIYPRPGVAGKTQQGVNAMRWNYVTDVHEVECEGFLFWRECKVHQTITVQAVVDFTRNNKPTKDATIGVITAFCIDRTWCPDWVKNALNI